ncbi:YhjD/YihY/BrkB family envelope integrity protein [Sphingopyxis chilensis]|uniref:YhjD/YihY/BrkB family envelope integrity protein n=1 Tax=Sphingopyxis chilensis TaxID=180400 RepID=UPI002DDDB3EA|nr:YhjD/YihY/BrkB family envelope integrity protein [Sphingopyxis chilensis]
MLATLLWLAATTGFSGYASGFGDHDTTHGSLGAVVVLLMWLHLSAYAVLLGALVNAETERRAARDTITGFARPMCERGAAMADSSAAPERSRPDCRGRQTGGLIGFGLPSLEPAGAGAERGVPR